MLFPDVFWLPEAGSPKFHENVSPVVGLVVLLKLIAFCEQVLLGVNVNVGAGGGEFTILIVCTSVSVQPLLNTRIRLTV